MNLSLWFPFSERRRSPFVYPVSIAIRTAVFEPIFRQSVRAPYIDPSASDIAEQVRKFRPAALAGCLDTLLRIERELDLLPTHGIVVLTFEAGSCLAETDRDAIWNAYRVPVFEEVVTPAGRLVAWECEAHEGLHLVQGAQAAPGCVVDSGACHCGLKSPRVIEPSTAPAFSFESDAPMPLLPGRIVSATRPTATYTGRPA